MDKKKHLFSLAEAAGNSRAREGVGRARKCEKMIEARRAGTWLKCRACGAHHSTGDASYALTGAAIPCRPCGPMGAALRPSSIPVIRL